MITKTTEYARKLTGFVLTTKGSIIRNVKALRKMYAFAYRCTHREIMNLVILETGFITRVNYFSSDLNTLKSICLTPLFSICL